jgi:DNA mismatch endonuclease (patch repair protein)
LASSDIVRRRMQTTLRRDTPAELALRSAVHRAGLRYRVDLRPHSSVRGRADLVFQAARVAVYVDGCFWHACPEHGTWPKANADWWRQKIEANIRRDRESDRRLTEAGWLVLRFWEHENPAEAARVIVRQVRRRRARSTRVGKRS